MHSPALQSGRLQVIPEIEPCSSPHSCITTVIGRLGIAVDLPHSWVSLNLLGVTARGVEFTYVRLSALEEIQ